MKTVNVVTYDSRIFQSVMTIVVKNDNDLYAVFLKDLCEMIQVDIKPVNDFLKCNYAAMKADNVPHLELQVPDKKEEWHYIQGGKKRDFTGEDVFFIPQNMTAALPYALLDIMRTKGVNTAYDERFAVVLSMTLNDCLDYAPKFEY